MSAARAFTISSSSLRRHLITDVSVTPYVNGAPDTAQKLHGMWDTGAACSCMDHRVVKLLSLTPAGKTSISTANGLAETFCYLVNLHLPNSIIVRKLLVPSADLGSRIDVLIGMDVINWGDFSVTNYDGRTVFSFRIPSLGHTDFTHTQEGALT